MYAPRFSSPCADAMALLIKIPAKQKIMGESPTGLRVSVQDRAVVRRTSISQSPQRAGTRLCSAILHLEILIPFNGVSVMGVFQHRIIHRIIIRQQARTWFVLSLPPTLQIAMTPSAERLSFRTQDPTALTPA
jgi:hypothetical protein